MKGKTITSIRINASETEIDFICEDGTKYKMLHFQECCEAVTIESIDGDIRDLLNTPLLMFEKVSSDQDESKPPSHLVVDDSYTWTFYKLATIKGYVTIRWFGTSNGYYSEEVDFIEVKDD